MATEQDKPQYDSFGFPVPEKKTTSQDGLKVFLWSLLAFFVISYTFTGLLAGYVAYSANMADPIYLLCLKVMGAFLFNWFYLGYKGVQKLLAGRDLAASTDLFLSKAIK